MKFPQSKSQFAESKETAMQDAAPHNACESKCGKRGRRSNRSELFIRSDYSQSSRLGKGQHLTMKRIALVAIVCCSGGLAVTTHAQSVSLPRSTPEAQGVSSAQIREYIETADKKVKSMHSFMLVRHGHVVAEAWWAPESAEKPHILWSLSKSFTSTAVGLAVAEGQLSIDDTVTVTLENLPRQS